MRETAPSGATAFNHPPAGLAVDLPALLPVTLMPAAVDSIKTYATASCDGLESGGLLLGHLYNDRVVVNYAGGPGPGAVRESTRFVRDLAFAQELAQAAWKLDRSIWIGEWHTHPKCSAAPSDIDMQTYAKHLNDPDLTLPTFLSLIVIPHPTGTVPACWLGRSSRPETSPQRSSPQSRSTTWPARPASTRAP